MTKTTKAADAPLEPFTFEHDGETYSLPSQSAIKTGVARAIRRLKPEDQVFTLLELVADEATLAAIDDMGSDEFADMCQKWEDHSGVSVPN